MISRIRQNFIELIENISTKKDEIFNQYKVLNLENILSFYEENKKLFCNKKEILLNHINDYISTIDLKLNLDLSFIEKIEKFYEDNCVDPIENDIRKKFIEKYKKLIKFFKTLYFNFSDLISNYILNYFSIKTERAPPIKFTFL
ncbi:hypothetical protein KST23_08530 [Fusobacterium nucleatum]|uniref:hypothetical protein n=1 Tax=Fusobacterium nucleatum TaxID=851 RepID=UPI003D041157